MTTRRFSRSTLLVLLVSILGLALIHVSRTSGEGRWVVRDQQTYYENFLGKPATGWQQIDGVQYHFTADGILTTGWATLNGSRYYFGTGGAMATGWQEIDGQTYYFSPGGTAVTGWQGIDGKRFYFLEDHTLADGMVQVGDTPYLFAGGLPAEGGWTVYQDRTYFVKPNGSLHTGWLTEGEYRYYFHPDGAMAVGQVILDGERVYFSPKGIHITLVNPWHHKPENYPVDLVAVDEDFAVDRACYDALTAMFAACEAAGLQPMICSAYRSQEDQEWLYERKVNFWLEEGLELTEAKKQAGRSVAVPGTSEHQLGLAVDIVSTDYFVLDESQATTKTQQWLMEHCWEYGFILRYPVDKSDITGIIYEPWHYRYVGVEVALDIRDSGLCLEEYLDAVSYG